MMCLKLECLLMKSFGSRETDLYINPKNLISLKTKNKKISWKKSELKLSIIQSFLRSTIRILRDILKTLGLKKWMKIPLEKTKEMIMRVARILNLFPKNFESDNNNKII
jgi:hypothetical protein